MIDPERRVHLAQVEDALRRPLTEEEIAGVTDLAALPPSHFAVVEQLHRKAPIQAFYYLLAVIGDHNRAELRRYVLEFDRILAQRDNRPVLGAQHLYEHELGRALTADEKVFARSLQSMTPAQHEVVRSLAVKDRDVALTYLAAVVPSSSWQERQAFLESLPRQE